MTTQLTDDEIDMLIRFTSFILHEVKPQVTFSSAFAPGSATTPHASLLDRIALLFVTKKGGDVVAVTTTLTQDQVTIFVAENPPSQSRDEPSAPTLVPDGLYQANFSPSTDWILAYLRAGSPTPSLHNHAAQLEYLTQQLQRA
ncbi:hypothetical protein FRB95_001720 [Tulasnella sp. JGI-2019a]|nr:hypothetical protein FRB95_001720 [Tulasnella sp. JGI-2019a]